jgi:uncharacterized protein YfiM (DUF2279 family)
MNPLTSVLLLLALQQQTLELPGHRPAPSGDRWIAEDKARHMFTSMALVNFAAAGARIVGLENKDALVPAIAGAAAAGILKEVYDKRVGKPFSFRDLAWDAVGIGLGTIVVSHAR